MGSWISECPSWWPWRLWAVNFHPWQWSCQSWDAAESSLETSKGTSTMLYSYPSQFIGCSYQFARWWTDSLWSWPGYRWCCLIKSFTTCLKLILFGFLMFFLVGLPIKEFVFDTHNNPSGNPKIGERWCCDRWILEPMQWGASSKWTPWLPHGTTWHLRGWLPI